MKTDVLVRSYLAYSWQQTAICAPTSIEDALRLLSAPSSRFWQQTTICPVSLWALVVELHLPNWALAQTVRRICEKLTMKELEEQRACVRAPVCACACVRACLFVRACVCAKFCCKLGKHFTQTCIATERRRRTSNFFVRKTPVTELVIWNSIFGSVSSVYIFVNIW
jgi:hypothetical protein